jgi:hypothetical protein
LLSIDVVGRCPPVACKEKKDKRKRACPQYVSDGFFLRGLGVLYFTHAPLLCQNHCERMRVTTAVTYGSWPNSFEPSSAEHRELIGPVNRSIAAGHEQDSAAERALRAIAIDRKNGAYSGNVESVVEFDCGFLGRVCGRVAHHDLEGAWSDLPSVRFFRPIGKGARIQLQFDQL